jgi:large subunit ribosomal protein L23
MIRMIKMAEDKAKKGKMQMQGESSPLVQNNILLYPITTEKAIGMIELENKLLFVVDKRATKEVERLFKVKVGSVNTKITPKGIKHAYIRLKEGKADDIAAQLKII